VTYPPDYLKVLHRSDSTCSDTSSFQLHCL